LPPAGPDVGAIADLRPAAPRITTPPIPCAAAGAAARASPSPGDSWSAISIALTSAGPRRPHAGGEPTQQPDLGRRIGLGSSGLVEADQVEQALPAGRHGTRRTGRGTGTRHVREQPLDGDTEGAGHPLQRPEGRLGLAGLDAGEVRGSDPGEARRCRLGEPLPEPRPGETPSQAVVAHFLRHRWTSGRLARVHAVLRGEKRRRRRNP
jgi:hypothetical protein